MENKTFLNLQEAVERNKEDIELIKKFGVKIDRYLTFLTDLADYITEENIGKYYYISEVGQIYTITRRSNGGLISMPIDVKGVQGDKGDKGDTGEQGKRGPGVFGITTEPGQLDYNYIEGDFYITTDYNLYKKHKNKWVLITNIRGARGPEGPVGSNNVVANPIAAAQDTITKISIDGVVYEIQGGSGGAPIVAGTGISIDEDIEGNQIISTDDTIATVEYVDTSVTGLVATSEMEDAIADAKSEIRAEIPTSTSELQNDSDFVNTSTVEEMISESISSVYKFKGSVPTYEDLLDIQHPENGDVYDVEDTGDNYAWVEITGTWDKLGSTVDLSNYYNKTETDARLATKQPVGSYATTAQLNTKQDILTAGEGIIIEDNVISTTGSGGGDYISYGEPQELTDTQFNQVMANLDLNATRVSVKDVYVSGNTPVTIDPSQAEYFWIDVTNHIALDTNKLYKVTFVIDGTSYVQENIRCYMSAGYVYLDMQVDVAKAGYRTLSIRSPRFDDATATRFRVFAGTYGSGSNPSGTVTSVEVKYENISYTPLNPKMVPMGVTLETAQEITGAKRFASTEGLKIGPNTSPTTRGITIKCLPNGAYEESADMTVGTGGSTSATLHTTIDSKLSTESFTVWPQWIRHKAGTIQQTSLGKANAAWDFGFFNYLSDGTTTKTMTEILAGGGGGSLYMHHLDLLCGDAPGEVALDLITSTASLNTLAQVVSELDRIYGAGHPAVGVWDDGVGELSMPICIRATKNNTLELFDYNGGEYVQITGLASDTVTQL